MAWFVLLPPSMKTVATLLAASLALASTAYAETTELKSENTATNAAIIGTLAPIALLVASSQTEDNTAGPALALAGGVGLLLGPSAGHWYSGQTLTKGLAMRVGGALVTTAALSIALNDDCLLFCDHQPVDPDDDNVMMGGVAFAGAALFVGGVIYDIATADDAARDYNASHEGQIAITPTAGKDQMGVAVAGSF